MAHGKILPQITRFVSTTPTPGSFEDILAECPTLAVVGTRGIPDIQGGVEHHCEELYPRVVSRGERVLLFTRSPYVSKAEPSTNAWRGVLLRKLWAPHLKHLEAFVHTFLAATVARWYGIKALHVHTVGCGLVVPYARLLGFRVLFTHHGYDYNRQKWNTIARWVLRVGESLAVRHAHVVFAVSREICDYIRIRYGREAVYLPNGVDEPGEAAHRTPSAAIAQIAPVLAHGYCCAVGRLVPEKGFDTLLDLYAESEGLPPMVIIGDADHASPYATALKARRATNVHFVGRLPHAETMDLISGAEVMVVPSFHEGLPIVTLEGLWGGALILASDIAPHREILGDSEFGVLFQAGDAGRLGDALRNLLSLPSDRKEVLRQKGMDMVRSRYNWNSTTEIFLASLHRV
jgi:alpha-maltose-1-phosphate synthase